MAPISRGFGGRRRDDVDPSRIPPGQYYEGGFPVLSAGSGAAHAEGKHPAAPSRQSQ